jgi:hypothetical protein
MTWKEIEKTFRDLRVKYYWNKCIWPENLLQPRSKKDEKLEEELRCRRMINSCLIYGYSHDYFFEKYAWKYIEKLWIRKVNKLFEEQENDIKKSMVKCSVYTDWEGCTYNSIKWWDE